ncbi:unnamed protein product [Trichobilharzia szidati]|nr:unnamed protein product [Trichobilharzia szidati]CAH8834685.1 unnamed protein product [Trichobilharzia szidati]
MGILILSALVILQSILISTEANKTFLLHVRWLPTHCYHRKCHIEDGQRWDISKLRLVPQLDWMSENCSYATRFWRYNLSAINELSKYWSNPLDEFTHYNHLYRDYAACTVVDSNGPTPYLYFNRGIDLFKIVSPSAISIKGGETYSTKDFEHSLLNQYHAQPKVICAADEFNGIFLDEIVFCFNEHSTLVDCPAKYANDLQTYMYTVNGHVENDYRKQIDQQKLCRDSFTVPEYKYKMSARTTEAPAIDYSEDTPSSSSDIFEDMWNWFWGL